MQQAIAIEWTGRPNLGQTNSVYVASLLQIEGVRLLWAPGWQRRARFAKREIQWPAGSDSGLGARVMRKVLFLQRYRAQSRARAGHPLKDRLMRNPPPSSIHTHAPASLPS